MDEVKRTPEGVIDFSQFKKKKEEQKPMPEPLFTEPMLITLGDPNNPESLVEYKLLINLVYNEKQFLAIQEVGNPTGEIGIVEAIVSEENEFNGVKVVDTEEEYEEITKIILKVLSGETEGDHDADNRGTTE